MTIKINKILYATDLSPNSAYAFRYALETAIKFDANITILHVFDPIATDYVRGYVPAYIGQELRKKASDEKVSHALDQIRERLREFCNRELKEYPKCADRVESIKVYEGYPSEEILMNVDELNCDVIVMGTHGKGGIKKTFVGSVANRVIRRSRKPVFVIPLPKGDIDITFNDI